MKPAILIRAAAVLVALTLAVGTEAQTVDFKNITYGDSVSSEGLVIAVEFDGIPQEEAGRLDVWLYSLTSDAYLAAVILVCEGHQESPNDFYSGYAMHLVSPDFYAQGCSVFGTKFNLVIKTGEFVSQVFLGETLELSAALRSIDDSDVIAAKSILLSVR
jgi:hypothetical protein